MLDGYWKSFETNIKKLEALEMQVKEEEKQLAALYQENLIDTEQTLFNDGSIIPEYYKIMKEVKVFKESFYEFMNGCGACSFKPN